ncbi:hypothetical protein AB6Q56_14645 [Dechloromonas sp. ARDL1]|uniref:hypothetical protein n=1 Tax=Dechloromonas sp. ARDL1 TaxID=3322121 RepID=UPI003DA74F1F
MSNEKPLFIPLKREYFEQFARGDKEWEFRQEGPRWNSRTCRIGRRVVLSLGYGKKHRMFGEVVDYRLDNAPTQTPAWKDCYGDKGGLAACIKIKLEGGSK